MLKRILIASFALTSSLASLAIATGASAQDRTITVASTTSTEQSGLFSQLLPKFTAATGIGVKVVRSAPARRSTSAGAAMPTWCSFTTRSRKRNSSPRVLA